MTTRNSLRGLDWLNFFVANLQTGFGPFIAVYLTGNRWTQADIGFALSVGTVVSMVGQVPLGAVVDGTPRKRLAAFVALLAIAASAALLAVWPAHLPVMFAEALHGVATCLLAPSIAAITLGLVGEHQVAERFGRNGRYAAAGNAIGAAIMGVCGRYVSTQSVFWLAAALTIPALFALRNLSRGGVTVPLRTREEPARPSPGPRRTLRQRLHSWRAMLNPRLLAFGLCAVLFHLSNAAMLPIAAGAITRQAGGAANLVIPACIVVPQVITAVISPLIGRLAERWGRRPVLLLGYAALPARALVLAAVTTPASVIGAQVFDGLGAAVFGLLVPLVSADLSRRNGRFNTSMGLIGLAVGLGASLSTLMAGRIATAFSEHAAFLALAAAGGLAMLAVLTLMPETRPVDMPVNRFRPGRVCATVAQTRRARATGLRAAQLRRPVRRH